MNELKGETGAVRVPKGWTHYVTSENGYVHVVYNMKNIAKKIVCAGICVGLGVGTFKGCAVIDDRLTRFDYLERGYSYSEKWDTWYRDDVSHIWNEATGQYVTSGIDPWEYESRGFRYSPEWDTWYKPVRRNENGTYYEYWDNETGRYERRGG